MEKDERIIAAAQFEIKLFDFFYQSKQLTDYIYMDMYCKLSKCIGQTPCLYEHCLVFSVIASDWKSTLVFHVNKLVEENDSFCPWKSGKSQENKFCRIVGTMHLGLVIAVHEWLTITQHLSHFGVLVG